MRDALAAAAGEPVTRRMEPGEPHILENTVA